MARSDVVVYCDDLDNCIARWHNVMLIIRRGRQSLEYIEHTRRAAREYEGAKMGIFYVYEPTAVLPDRACRHATAEAFVEYRERVVCAAVAFEGDGLGRTVIRVTVQAFFGLFGHKLPRFACASVEEAAAWMQPRLASSVDPSPPSVAALSETVAQIRVGGVREVLENGRSL